jgi:hypothetical protein
LSTLYALVLYTVSGVLTAKIWRAEKKYQIVLITLLTTITPYLTHNLYSNTNNWTVPTSTLFAVIALYSIQKSYKLFVPAVILFTCAIGGYQTVIPCGFFIVMGYVINLLLSADIKSYSPYIKKSILMIIMIAFSYFISNIVVKIYCIVNNLEIISRYATATEIVSLKVYIRRIIDIYIYHIKEPFNKLIYFKHEIAVITALLFLVAGIACVYIILSHTRARNRTKQGKLIACISIALIAVLVLHLPKMFGITLIPIRAFFQVGLMLAFAFLITSKVPGAVRSSGIVITIFCLIFSALYANVFYYGAFRQTQADIGRMHEVAARIRSNPNYANIKEPFGFLIVGERGFPVVGYRWWQQALYTPYSKYEAFKKFTDLDFYRVNHDTERKIIANLIGKEYKSYPAYNSIVFYENKIILILDSNKIKRMQETL